MTSLDATRIHFGSLNEVVPKNAARMESPPYVELCIEDGLALGQPWSLFVDLVSYHKALYAAKGKSGEALQDAVKAHYLQALVQLDIDEFEAEMFWETYLDTEWERENPYDLGDEQTEAVYEDDGPVEEIEVDDEDGLAAVERLRSRQEY